MPRFGLCTQLLHRGRNSNMNLIFQLSNDNGSSWVGWGGGEGGYLQQLAPCAIHINVKL